MCTPLDRVCEGKQISSFYEISETVNLFLAKGNHFVIVVFLLPLFISWLSSIMEWSCPLLYQCWMQIIVFNYSKFKIFINCLSKVSKTNVPNFNSTNSLREVLSSNVSPIKFPLHLLLYGSGSSLSRVCWSNHVSCLAVCWSWIQWLWEPSRSTSISFHLCLHWCHSSSLKVVTIRIITPQELLNAINQSFKKGWLLKVNQSLTIAQKLGFCLTTSIALW